MNIFSFDAEPEGLYGPPFAIGAVVLRRGEEAPIKTFGGRIHPTNPDNVWVKERVKAASSLPLFSSREELLEAFWTFWMENREGAVCVSDWGSPVESGLMRLCVLRDEGGRQFLGPTPLHEVSTALLCAGIDPDIDRIAWSKAKGLTKHNPVHDATASGLCFLKALA